MGQRGRPEKKTPDPDPGVGWPQVAPLEVRVLTPVTSPDPRVCRLDFEDRFPWAIPRMKP